MTKYLLISIRPQHVYNILIGKKTREFRKMIPNWVLEEVANGETVKALIYCTKAEPYLHQTEKYILEEYPKTPQYILQDDPMISGFNIFNGHVVAQFEINKIDDMIKYAYSRKDLEFYETLEKACITLYEVSQYSPIKITDDLSKKHLYAIHISNLKVFDKPKELADYYVDWYRGQFYPKELTKAPQNMMQVWGDE